MTPAQQAVRETGDAYEAALRCCMTYGNDEQWRKRLAQCRDQWFDAMRKALDADQRERASR